MKYRSVLIAGGLLALSSTPAFAAGDPEAGKAQYAICGSCHGMQAEGQEALNAPKLAGQEAWYTIRQINNFKNGIRGKDPKDTYGMQMAPMAAVLATDEAVEDVAAYIESLGE